MKKYILFATALIGLLACSKEMVSNVESEVLGETITLTASIDFDAPETRVAPNDSNSYGAGYNVAFHWQEGDTVLLTNFSDYSKFALKAGSISSDGKTAQFTGKALPDMSSYIAFYAGKNTDSTTVKKVFSFNSVVELDNVGGGHNVIAHNIDMSDPENLVYKGDENGFTLCTFLNTFRLKLKGDVTLGKVEYWLNDAASDATHSIINFGSDGLTLTSTAQEVWIPVYGLGTCATLRFYDTSGNLIMEKIRNKDFEKAYSANGNLISFPELEVKKKKAAPGLCFTALEAGANVGMTIDEGGNLPHLVYSTDGGATWTSGDWDGTDILLANSGDKVYFKAGEQGNYGTIDQEMGYPAMFTTSGNLKVNGNIMYLLNGSTPPTTMTEYNMGCFYDLFAGSTITDASELELPAMSLSVACYSEMFNGCSSLSSAPALPATTLASNCYSSMFCDCTSLTAAPMLPAKTLQFESYVGMFSGCSNLSSVTMLATEVTGKNDYDKDCTWDECIEEWLSHAGTNALSPTLTVAGSITDVKTPDTPGERIAAYAPLNWTIKNENGTTLLSPFVPGEFSVSATKKVKFTRGNLYRSTNSFQVESSQTAYPTSWENNHVGHFFWTKTAAASYAETYSDGECTVSDHFFADGSDADHTLTVDGQSGLYVLSKDEWNYLLSTRGTGDSYFKYGVKVNGAENCLVIAPDGYCGIIAESYDAAAWSAAESSGLVCLPAAGSREGSVLSSGGSFGRYSSATAHSSDTNLTNYLLFNDSTIMPSKEVDRKYGLSIRLVHDAN